MDTRLVNISMCTKDLAKAVEQEILRDAGKEMIKFTVATASGHEFECEGFAGMSLKDVAGSWIKCGVGLY